MAIKTNENLIPFSNSVTFRTPRGSDLVTASELSSLGYLWFNLYAYERPFMHCLYLICERKFYARTHVKIMRH